LKKLAFVKALLWIYSGKSLILAQYVATTKPIIIDVMFPKSVRDSKLKIKKRLTFSEF